MLEVLVEKSLYVKLPSLQFFGDSATAAAAEPAAEPAAGAGAAEPAAEPGAAADTGKTFTQEEVNKLITAKSRAAQEKALKDLGFEDFDTAKDGIEKFKAYLDSQKSDEQKKQEKLDALFNEKATWESEKDALSFKVTALTLDVNPENLNDVHALVKARMSADSELTYEAATKALLEAYPNFKKESEAEKKPPGSWTLGNATSGSNAPGTKLEQRLAKYKK